MSRNGWRALCIGLLFALALLPAASGEAAAVADEQGARLVTFAPQWLVGLWAWVTETGSDGSGATTDGSPAPSAPVTPQGTSGDTGMQTDPGG